MQELEGGQGTGSTSIETKMRFIIVDNRTGRARSIGANGLVLGLAFAGLVALPPTTGFLGYQFGVHDAEMNQEQLKQTSERGELPLRALEAELRLESRVHH